MIKFRTCSFPTLICAIGFLSYGSVACQNTAEGVKEDATVAQSEAKQEVKGIAAAAELTAPIKAALIANPFLKGVGDKIDVSTNNESVALEGVVQTEKQKKIVEDTAKEVLKNHQSELSVHNHLTIEKA